MDAITRRLAALRQQDLIREAEQRRLNREARRPAPALPRELWFVVGGIFLNYLGYGAVLPFEIIYLHQGRGLDLGTAGVVIGLVTGVAVLTAGPAGTLIDRFGPRRMAAVGGLALAAGYAGLAVAASPGPALLAGAVAGAGNGVLNPSQSTLVATLTPPHLRHRATALSRVAGNAGAGLGGAVGGLVATAGLPGFVGLLLANAASYLVFVAVLLLVVREAARPQPLAGGYRLVLRDRALVRLAVVNVALIAVGWGVFTWLLPPYASGGLGLSTPLIGVLLLANTATVTIVQLPVARLAEGHRRVVPMALAAATFTLACVLVVVAGGSFAIPALLGASILVGVGECLHTTVLMPLTADLGPAPLRGRYMAAIGLSWWIGLAVAPVLGAPFLDRFPVGVFVVAAAIASGAGMLALTLDRRLPAAARRTPSEAAPDAS